MHTGDGIERVSGADALLTPDGGEGGSVPQQALGSKAEERAKRRKKKKDSYAKYLESPTWKKIRAAALKRDKHTCRACSEKATVVHHVRYPKNLGEEKMDWLYSLCAPCHDGIHRLHGLKGTTLRAATDTILAAPNHGKSVIYLPDDWRLSETASRRRTRRKLTGTEQHKQHKQPKTRKRKTKRVAAEQKKKSKLTQENERLRAIFKANREYRDRRWGHA